jgi:hypothetical protein
LFRTLIGRSTRSQAMDSLPIWAIWSTIPGVVVLAPVLAFLLATATVIIIGLLKEVGLPAALALAVAGVTGYLLLRKARARSRSFSVAAVEGRSLGGMTRAAVDNVTPFPASASRQGVEPLDRRSTGDARRAQPAVNRPFTLAQSRLPSAKG